MIDAVADTHFASERLAMRPQTVDDADWLFEGYGDADLMTWWSSAPHADVAETRAYLAPRIAKPDWRGWAMIARDTGTPIGTLAAGEKRAGVAEIGYLLLRCHWGRGYAREGVSRLIDMLFAEGYRRIMADTDPDNIASNTLLTRLGFTCEGRLRAEWETHIGIRDSFIWGLLREEWPR
ncbi:GNAT family N-acetyltransferase [Sphingomonas floccifaciens]|uniref:GNAT family N-acetyltransferase n=1 Tax=Sphingomonas floccifaciens TaxID=1844115 RepID=A0ABW4NB77_9SPHN